MEYETFYHDPNKHLPTFLSPENIYHFTLSLDLFLQFLIKLLSVITVSLKPNLRLFTMNEFLTFCGAPIYFTWILENWAVSYENSTNADFFTVLCQYSSILFQQLRRCPSQALNEKGKRKPYHKRKCEKVG